MSTIDRTATLLDVIHDVHALPTLDAFRQETPTLVHRLVDADLVAYQEIDLPARATSAVMRGPRTTARHPAFDELLARLLALLPQHPVFRAIAATRDGSARAISDLWDRPRYRASDLYREVYCHLGTEDLLVIALAAPAPVVIGVPVSRDRWGFTDDEHRTMDALRPHLSQARANLVVLESARSRLADRERALAAVGIALVDVTPAGAVQAAGDVAAVLRRIGVVGMDGRWTGDAAAWWAAARRPSGLAQPVPLRVADGAGAVVLRAVAPGVVVVRRVRGIDPAWLLGLGLSSREADVLARLAGGAVTTAELAASAGIARATVLRHLESIYRKLGVHSRAEAVAAAFDAAAVDGAPFV